MPILGMSTLHTHLWAAGDTFLRLIIASQVCPNSIIHLRNSLGMASGICAHFCLGDDGEGRRSALLTR